MDPDRSIFVENMTKSTMPDQPEGQSSGDSTPLRRSIRVQQNPHFQHYKSYHGLTLTETSSKLTTPTTYQEAMSGPQACRWTTALQKELESLSSHGVFSCVELPSDREAIDGRCMFSESRMNLTVMAYPYLRSDLYVGKGFQQTEGVDFQDTYSPTLRRIALRLLLAISAAKHHTVQHFDVDTAFLNAELREEVYINIPTGAHKPTPTSVWRLHKALYGLKQANRGWKENLTATLKSAGITPPQWNHVCTFTQTTIP
jgi:hypothetical protein